MGYIAMIPNVDEGYFSRPLTPIQPNGNDVAKAIKHLKRPDAPQPCDPQFQYFVYPESTSPSCQYFSEGICVEGRRGSETFGEISAQYIDLSSIHRPEKEEKGSSWFRDTLEPLGECNSDGRCLAEDLFTPRGTMRTKHISDYAEYVGPWGRELETGAILCLELVFVNKKFRRQGLASELLRQTISNADKRAIARGSSETNFVVVHPGVVDNSEEYEQKGLTMEERTEMDKREYDRAVRFYRSQGFRRIGLSKWFGLALDPEHPSRQIRVEDDLNPTEDDE